MRIEKTTPALFLWSSLFPEDAGSHHIAAAARV